MTFHSASYHVRALGNRSHSHLMCGENGDLHVVRFHSTIRPPRHLLSQYLATKLARQVGLPAPDCDIVHVSQLLIDGTPDLRAVDGSSLRLLPGFQLGSRFIGTRSGDSLMEYLPVSYLSSLTNLPVFAGIFAFDRWCANSIARRVLFRRETSPKGYSAHFVDHTGCFDDGNWRLRAEGAPAFIAGVDAYSGVEGWHSFEPFISGLVSITRGVICDIAQQMPHEWYDGNSEALERLIDSLVARQSHLHGLVANAIHSFPSRFPNWREHWLSLPNRRSHLLRIRSSSMWPLTGHGCDLPLLP
jgi:hypothetical protein